MFGCGVFCARRRRSGGPHYKTGTLYMQYGASWRECSQHTWTLGSPVRQIFRMNGNSTGGTETNSHRRVEGGRLLKNL